MKLLKLHEVAERLAVSEATLDRISDVGDYVADFADLFDHPQKAGTPVGKAISAAQVAGRGLRVRCSRYLLAVGAGITPRGRGAWPGTARG